jgi:hypothetical protein
MSMKTKLSFQTLPVEFIYRILNHLDLATILLSCRNVCTRLNAIIDTYHPYLVMFTFLIKSYFDHLQKKNIFFSFEFRDITIWKRSISLNIIRYLVVFYWWKQIRRIILTINTIEITSFSKDLFRKNRSTNISWVIHRMVKH